MPRLGWPPWKRVYGFRSDPRALDEIEATRAARQARCCASSSSTSATTTATPVCVRSGPSREFLLAYTPALHPESPRELRERFGDRLIEIGDADAAIYAANSFALVARGPVAARDARGRLRASSSTRSARAARASSTADVSEFHKKGGGSVKCMIGDLGELPLPARGAHLI